MSTFRPPQVPIQPQTFFTPGQPLGIPKAFTDPQFQQIEAYFRPRPDTEAFEYATRVARVNFTIGTPPGIPQPRQNDQTQAEWRQHVEIPQPLPPSLTLSGPAVQIPRQSDQTAAYWRQRPDLEALEEAALIVDQPVTAGQPLGIPNPIQGNQAAAYFRPRPDTEAAEDGLQIVNTNFTPGQPLGIPQPVQGNQSAAYFRPRPDTEAAEEALQIVNANFTPAQPLGIPTPRQMEQVQAIWRPRPDLEALEVVLNITQPDFTPSGPAIGFVPPLPLQILPTARQDIALLQPQQLYVPQPLNLLVFVVAPDYIGFEETPDEPPLQTPIYLTASAPPVQIPRQSDQFAAYFRERQQLEALEEATQTVDQAVTAGQPLGIPNPVQTDQTQAIWRQHFEIQQPVYYAPIPPPQFYAPKYEFQMAAYMRGWRPDTEALEEALTIVDQPATTGQPLGTPQPKQSDQTAAYWRQRWDQEAFGLAASSYSDNVLPPQLAFVPALALQMPYGPGARYEAWIALEQPLSIPPPAPYLPKQTDQGAAYFRPRFENWQPPVKFTIGSPIITQGGIGERIVLVSGDRMIMIVEMGGRQFQVIN